MTMGTGNGSTTLRRYRLRGERGEWLADVVIGDDGYFSTVSEWGNYAYWWGSAGDCFRSFLAQIDDGYLVSKIAPIQEYDGDTTLEEVRRYIIEMRREGSLDRKKAREQWDLLKDCGNLEEREDFARWFDRCDGEIFCCPGDFYRSRSNKKAVMFAERVLPVLQRVLREELEKDKVAKTLIVLQFGGDYDGS